MFKLEILTKDDETIYNEFLNKLEYGSVQHSLEWRNVICDLGKDEPCFIVAKENDEIQGILPLYYYKCNFGNLLTSIPWYTISGIICSKGVCFKELYKAILDYSLILGKELDCIAISISTNPFKDDRQYYIDYFGQDYTLENFIQYTCVNEIFDRTGNYVHSNYLRNSTLRTLRRAERQPVIVSDEQTHNNVAELIGLYKGRMRELDAIPIPKELYESVLKNLIPKRKGKFLFAFYHDSMIAGCLFLPGNMKIDAYMMAMDLSNCKLGATYILADHMLKWAYENGFSSLNWMSSPNREGGIYKWKKRWGSHERTCLYLTRILSDISHLKSIDYEELKRAYGFHYLLPFNLLNNHSSKFTTKDEVTSYLLSMQRH